jgi:hypothetical protein
LPEWIVIGDSSDQSATEMNISVQCHAGYKADQRPVRFQLGSRDYVVEEIVDQWYGPDDVFFKVRADDGNLYILRLHTNSSQWSLESFRQGGGV